MRARAPHGFFFFWRACRRASRARFARGGPPRSADVDRSIEAHAEDPRDVPVRREVPLGSAPTKGARERPRVRRPGDASAEADDQRDRRRRACAAARRLLRVVPVLARHPGPAPSSRTRDPTRLSRPLGPGACLPRRRRRPEVVGSSRVSRCCRRPRTAITGVMLSSRAWFGLSRALGRPRRVAAMPLEDRPDSVLFEHRRSRPSRA